jgi:rhamnosyltransferase subunit B
MKKFLLLTFGSLGDVLPFIWLGQVLLQHGHRVVLISRPDFARHVVAAGLEFKPIRNESCADLLADPGWSQKIHATRLAYQYAGRVSGEFIEAIEEWMSEHGQPDLMLASSGCFGARLMREKLSIPLVTVHLSPLQIPSIHAPAILIPAMRWLRQMPFWMRKLILSRPNPLGRHAVAEVSRHCLKHGVAVPQDLDKEWGQSPDGVLSLFPDWFARPQPDWPQHLLQWDFPMEDMGRLPLEPALLAFLNEGEKPVVFTPGTGNVLADSFFAVALELVQKLRCRAVFATRDLTQLPATLPAAVHAVDYAPFSSLLPHASAFVHHGGIGTTSQALAAGLPQLIVPMAHDQFDNADRVERLGAGLALGPRGFRFKQALPLLMRCLQDPGIRLRAAACAERMRQRADTEKLEMWLAQKCKRPQSQNTDLT